MAIFEEIREYDLITFNPDYKERDGYTYVDESVFNCIVEFIHEFNGSNTQADAIDFLKCFTKKNIGDVISAQNYVGLIQTRHGHQIQILPKIDFSVSKDKAQISHDTRRIFLKMLRSMKDFPGKVFNDATMSVDRMNLYEMFIHMYLQDVRQLVKNGLKSAYIKKEENLPYYKGKLLVNQNIKQNLVHKERFYVSYDEYSINRPENRLIKSTLLKLLNLTGNSENAKMSRQLLASFEMVDISTNFEKDFTRVVIDRTTKDYEKLMKWSRVILFNKSFKTFSGESQSRALLFPMESVYENYVAQKVKKAFIPEGWSVKTQERGFYLFEEPTKQFALRPDIVMRKGNRTVIMDTKWKTLIDNPARNYGISQSDMYQMYAYSKKYRTPEIWLLYPITNEMRNHERIRYKAANGSEMETDVNVFFIDLTADDIREDSFKKLALEVIDGD